MAVIWILFLLMELIFQSTSAFQEYNKTITISDKGNNTTECCVDGKCPCSSLEIALRNVNNNTLINITSAKEALTVQINMKNVSMVGITGSNDTVIDCNNTGGVLYFFNCKEIDIFGITFYQCGNSELLGAISLDHSHNISITNCTFQSSKIYGITVESLPGRIVINDTEFLCNNKSLLSSGLFIQQTKEGSTPMHLELVIIRSVFDHNGAYHLSDFGSYGGGMSIFINDSSSQVKVFIEDSVFIGNVGSFGGGIYVSTNVASNYFNGVIQLKHVSFVNNTATASMSPILTTLYNSGDAIYYTTSGNSTCFTVTSSTIRNNMAIQSAALYTSVLMDKSMWSSVKGSFRLSIEADHNLYASFSNMNLVRTQVSITMGKHYVLKFDRSNFSYNSSLTINEQGSHAGQCTINNCQFSNNHIHTPIIDVHMDSFDSQHFIRISNTTISSNSNMDGSIIHLAYQSIMGDVQLSSVAFTGNTAAESTLYVYNCKMKITDKISFSNNAGKSGAAIYFDDLYAVLSDNADIEFKNNVAALGGGAIYAECPDDHTWLLFHQTGKSVTFINNVATEIGNSIYFSIPRDDIITRDPTLKSSIMYIPSQFNYSGKSYQSEIATSPYNLILNPPAVCVSTQCDNGGDYTIEGIMLGEELTFTAKVVDYFNDSAEGVIFMIECSNNCEDYSLTEFTKYKSVLIQENPLRNITIVGKEVTNFNTTVSLHLSQVIGTITSNVQTIEVSLSIVLHPCKTGFKYDDYQEACVCNDIPNLVRCMLNDARIKRGYWYGNLDGNIVVEVCPISYCDYPSCDINEDYCSLSSVQDHQCHSHRTGTACGNCENNYTLAFDLEDCIPTSDCHIWLTIVIIISVMIYWVLSLLAILCITGFVNVPVITGYAYGIIYFYSILYLFVGNNLVSNTMTTFVTILSGFANLTPRFLGMLCFVKGLRGIDQQFIHYVHPLAISSLLFLISRVAKHSVTVTKVLGRAGIIHATCLFILLSYTSIASTSMQLLRPVIFTKSNGDHVVCTYLSPDIQYFTGRHIIYTIVAVICLIVIALGLPVFLLLQPYLKKSRRINFIRILPLLDQFQQCFKTKYHSVAAFYLICRLLIFVILGMDMIQYSTRFLILQIFCFTIAMIHAWLQPYKENKLNSHDQTILLIALMIVSLSAGVAYTSLNGNTEMNDSIVAILALLPLVLFVGFMLSSTALGRLLWQKLACNTVNFSRHGSTVRSVS